MRIATILIIILLVIAISLVCIDMYRLTRDTAICVKSPLTYGVNEMSKSNNREIFLTCYMPDAAGIIIITNESIKYSERG